MATVMQEKTDKAAQQAAQPLLDQMAKLLDDVRRGKPCMAENQSSIPAEEYLSEDRWQRERNLLFRKFPLIVGHVSELPEPGTCLRLDVAGLPVVLTRDIKGELHAFLNVCRHRGMQLHEKDGPCQRKTLTCPYHGWTYELDGALKHVPFAEAFPDLPEERRRLVELPCAVVNGLILVTPTPGAVSDFENWFGSMSSDFTHLGMQDSVLYRKVDVIRECNWKLIIDAFLEAYHVRVLHRDSVYPFFMDALAVTEPVGRHMRSVIARRKITEALELPREQWDLREHASVSHYVFPNSIFVHHPDYSSVLTFYPVAVDKMRWIHHMLIPKERNTEAEKPHWEKTFKLIEGGVFQREDVHVAEGMQIGLKSGANEALVVGRMEYTIPQFHRTLQEAMDEVSE